jgi:hypothetical protein
MLAPINVGDGILGKDKSSASPQLETKQNKNIQKATSLLDELSREEQTGFKAEIVNSKANTDLKQRVEGTKSGLTNKSKKSKRSEEDNYEEEFDDIEEDLP